MKETLDQMIAYHRPKILDIDVDELGWRVRSVGSAPLPAKRDHDLIPRFAVDRKWVSQLYMIYRVYFKIAKNFRGGR